MRTHAQHPRRWRLGLTVAAVAVGWLGGCDEAAPPGRTPAGAPGGVPAATTPSGTGGTAPEPSSSGCAGAAACLQLCRDAQDRLEACAEAAGPGGGAAEGDTGGGGAGGSAQAEPVCDERQQCVSRCVLAASCEQILLGDPRYQSCRDACSPCGC
jgi:hypothetical protein